MTRIPEAALAKGCHQFLEPANLLASIKGCLDRVAVVQNLEHPTVPGQAFSVVGQRPNAPLRPSALVQDLGNAEKQAVVNMAGQGTVVAFVTMGEGKDLRIVIPPALLAGDQGEAA